jgi:hypothetical protein
MARGGRLLPKVSSEPTMPDPFMPCGRAIPETALRLFQGWSAHKVGSLLPSSAPLDTPRRTPVEGDGCEKARFAQLLSFVVKTGCHSIVLICVRCDLAQNLHAAVTSKRKKKSRLVAFSSTDQALSDQTNCLKFHSQRPLQQQVSRFLICPP